MKLNIHFHIDSTYTQETIKFINTNFSMEENIHIVTGNMKVLQFVRPNSFSNIHVVDIKKIKEIRRVKIILKKIKQDNTRCFYHYLSNDSIILTHLFGLYKIERNWIIWGADLYAYIDYNLYSQKTVSLMKDKRNKKSLLLNRIYRTIPYKIMLGVRREFLKSLNKILTWNKGDYKLACNNFLISPIHEEFLYDLGLEKGEFLDEFNNNSKEKLILVGNSGDPSNNHIDIYEALTQIKGNFKVMSFLTYGDQDYIQRIIEIGYEILGEKFIPITDHMKREDYLNFIEKIDVVIMNHYRQQGVGNIVSLLLKGKKIYMNDFVTTFQYMTGNGVKVFSIKELMDVLTIDELIEYESKVKKLNSETIYNLFCHEMALQKMKNIFEKK